MTKQDKMNITNLLVIIKQIEDEIERLRLFDNQIEANYNRVFDYGVTNRIMLDEQCRKIGELKAKFEAKSCDFVKTAQTHAVQDFADKLKTRFEEKEQHYICMYDWNGHSAVVDCANEVDELLKEYENESIDCV